jgi:hypothetical protein
MVTCNCVYSSIFFIFAVLVPNQDTAMASSSKPFGLKRKLMDACTCSTSEVKVARIVSQNHFPSSSYLQKKQCCCLMPMQPTLAESCLSYLTSGSPARVMFYSQNQWCTFPETALRVLIKGFKEDKSSTIVFSDGETILVDFLSMTAVNLKTKKHRSIAWIDEAGKCFFPPLFIDQESSKELHEAPPGRAEKFVQWALHESQSPELSAADMLRKNITPVEKGTQIFLSVQNLFLSGMGPFSAPDIILHIYRYHPDGSDSVANSRLVDFERRMGVEISGKGVDMTSGWFGCGKREMARVLIYGFSMSVKPNEGSSCTDLCVMSEDRSFAWYVKQSICLFLT